MKIRHIISTSAYTTSQQKLKFEKRFTHLSLNEVQAIWLELS